MMICTADTSLTNTGLALVETLAADAAPRWEVGTIKPRKNKGLSGELAEYVRMTDMVSDMAEFFANARGYGRMDLAVIEAPAYSRSEGKAHERGGLWWLTYGMMLRQSVPVLVVKPNLRAKYATGNGLASKDEVMLAASRRYADVPMRNNNEADAVLLAVMGARWLGSPIDSVPKTHLDAMKTLTL